MASSLAPQRASSTGSLVIVAESFGARLTAFDMRDDGTLGNGRIEFVRGALPSAVFP